VKDLKVLGNSFIEFQILELTPKEKLDIRLKFNLRRLFHKNWLSHACRIQSVASFFKKELHEAREDSFSTIYTTLRWQHEETSQALRGHVRKARTLLVKQRRIFS